MIFPPSGSKKNVSQKNVTDLYNWKKRSNETSPKDNRLEANITTDNHDDIDDKDNDNIHDNNNLKDDCNKNDDDDHARY